MENSVTLFAAAESKFQVKRFIKEEVEVKVQFDSFCEETFSREIHQ